MIPFEIKTGDVLVVYGTSLIDRGIELAEHGGPSHVALFLTPTELQEAQGGRTVGECDLSFYLNSNAKLEVWRDPTLADAERAEMIRFAHTLYGERYDYALIPLEFLHLECGLPLGWYHNKDSMICSVDVERIAEHVGRKWSKAPNPAPVDLVNGGMLIKVGDLPTTAAAG